MDRGQSWAMQLIDFKTFRMTTLRILGHPLAQLFSFCIILVGSAYFGGPYIYFLWHAVQEFLAYAIFGWMGIIITICALFFTGRGAAVLQFTGAAVMVVSLLVFLFSAERFMNIYTFRQLVPLLTLGLFVAVMVFVVKKFIKMGGL